MARLALLLWTWTWRRTHHDARLAHVHANPKSLLHEGPVASLDQLRAPGRVYLLPLGALDPPYDVNELANWLRTKYPLDVAVLARLPLDKAAWDSDRGQYVGELLCDAIERAHAEVLSEPNATVIGLTDQNMYRAHDQGELSYTTRCGQHTAVVSAYGFTDSAWRRRRARDAMSAQDVEAKVRKFLLKDVAILHWHLPLNNDPTSLLQDSLKPDIPAEDIYQTDLNPAATRWGASVHSACLYFTYSAKAGMQPEPGPTVRNCGDHPDVPSDESVERMEVDLQNGVVRDERTDLYLEDSIPIRLRRVLRPGGTNPTEFGVSGSHSYDKYLWASHMSEINLVGPDFWNEPLRRVPLWLPFELLNKWVDEAHSGHWLTMTYHEIPHERFEIKDVHGNVECYLPCDGPIPCYLEGYRDARGQTMGFERSGKDRNLMRLTSPSGKWLRFTYEGTRLADVHDSQGRSVQYNYNAQNQLVRVVHADGEITSYEYDPGQRLLSFSVAASTASPFREMLRNTYDPAGQLIKQTFADGSTYLYTHHPVADRYTQCVSVATPDGRRLEVYTRPNGGSVFERTDGRPGDAVALASKGTK